MLTRLPGLSFAAAPLAACLCQLATAFSAPFLPTPGLEKCFRPSAFYQAPASNPESVSCTPYTVSLVPPLTPGTWHLSPVLLVPNPVPRP